MTEIHIHLPKKPLRFNVGFLVGAPIGSSRDFHFEYPNVRLQDDFDLTDFTGVARVGRTPQGLLVQGTFEGDTVVQCVRCLNDTRQHLATEFDELYAFSERSMTDSGLLVPEDGYIDLEGVVRDYLMIEIPISPLCKPDCKGLCSVCGEDLNKGSCEHQLTP
ncbi:MAG: DUF177 domain-containing protein [Anaerolineaceae bacterium]